jgi:type I restriction enzyme M protein
MTEASLLHCPIRGGLRVRQRAADQLTFTEEKQRIDAIRYLLQRKYPKENFAVETTLFKLGNAGRNSFRTDFAIYDQPVDDLRHLTLEDRLSHLRLLAEVKRDNTTAASAKATQVVGAIQLVPSTDALGVYWDDVEQRFFSRKLEGKKSVVCEAPIGKIPAWGSNLDSTKLTYNDLEPAKDLVRIFDAIEDAIHTYVVDKSERYTLIQQLLLLKIHDENIHKEGRGREGTLDFQDFTAEAISDSEVRRLMNSALSKAAAHYNLYLPSGKQIDAKFNCSAEVLRNATKLLALVNILGSKVQVIQQFYMKFAKSLYKWDLAQYFTPHEVIDFIVDLVNPRRGEHVYDPACGSADFLISAFRRVGTPADPCVWGADNSEQAVQVSILNMVMNGDGKTQIDHHDSLSSYSERKGSRFSSVLCNPPFGTKIVERRFEVLRKFDMGHRWTKAEVGAAKTDEVRVSQQTGILFAELCVRLAAPRGRVGIILPNGYLGNRSVEYVALREWLLRHTKVVAIVAFPRFTFKKSGADVSASVVLLERREKPLATAKESSDYIFFCGNIESVGWRAGDSKAALLYKRDPLSGELLLNEENEPELDADFRQVLVEFLQSPAIDYFDWTIADREIGMGPQSEGIDIAEVASISDLNLDPKRYSSKYRAVRRRIEEEDCFCLGDVLELASKGRPNVVPSNLYQYVEIELIGIGEYDFTEMRGWQLPGRARLLADAGDIFIPHLWGSAGKWFMAAGDCRKLIVTNGCTRLRLKEGRRAWLADIVMGLSSEAFSVQMRALSTGSDGLAEISDDDLMTIVLPRISSSQIRSQIEDKLGALVTGTGRFGKFAQSLVELSDEFPGPPARKSHCALV